MENGYIYIQYISHSMYCSTRATFRNTMMSTLNGSVPDLAQDHANAARGGGGIKGRRDLGKPSFGI